MNASDAAYKLYSRLYKPVVATDVHVSTLPFIHVLRGSIG